MSDKTQLKVFTAAADNILAQADYYKLDESHGLSERWLAAVADTLLQLLYLPESRPRIALTAYRGIELPSDLRRSLVIGFPQHLIFYRYAPDEDIVKVIDVVAGHRELDPLLKEMLMDE
jgi:plasmid stabilization system protein ParE